MQHQKRLMPRPSILVASAALASAVALTSCASATDESPLRKVGATEVRPVAQVLDEIRTTQPAPDHPQIEPDVGSYYFHVALDRKCAEPSAQRTQAIAQLKQQFLARQRQFVAAVMRGRQLVIEQRRLDDVERNGPPARELAAFDVYLSSASPNDVAEMCRHAPVRITERIAAEKVAAEKQTGDGRRSIEVR